MNLEKVNKYLDELVTQKYINCELLELCIKAINKIHNSFEIENCDIGPANIDILRLIWDRGRYHLEIEFGIGTVFELFFKDRETNDIIHEELNFEELYDSKAIKKYFENCVV